MAAIGMVTTLRAAPVGTWSLSGVKGSLAFVEWSTSSLSVVGTECVIRCAFVSLWCVVGETMGVETILSREALRCLKQLFACPVLVASSPEVSCRSLRA